MTPERANGKYSSFVEITVGFWKVNESKLDKKRNTPQDKQLSKHDKDLKITCNSYMAKEIVSIEFYCILSFVLTLQICNAYCSLLDHLKEGSEKCLNQFWQMFPGIISTPAPGFAEALKESVYENLSNFQIFPAQTLDESIKWTSPIDDGRTRQRCANWTNS